MFKIVCKNEDILGKWRVVVNCQNELIVLKFNSAPSDKEIKAKINIFLVKDKDKIKDEPSDS